VCSEEFVARRRLADGNCDDAHGTRAFDGVQVAAQGAEFGFVGVELLLDLRQDAGVLRFGFFRRLGRFIWINHIRFSSSLDELF
jgi:hypothetical protein